MKETEIEKYKALYREAKRCKQIEVMRELKKYIYSLDGKVQTKNLMWDKIVW